MQRPNFPPGGLHRDRAQPDDHHGKAFSLTRPPFRLPPEPPPPRDRYRVARPHEERSFDIVDDDEQYGDLPLDAFDQELLQEPYPDRQRQAEQGHARLSLAPGPSRHFGGGVTQPQAQYSYREQEVGRGYDDVPVERPQERTPDLSRYTYDVKDFPDSSSEPQAFPDSSPAFRASQRRGGPYHSGGQAPSTPVRDEYRARTAAQKPFKPLKPVLPTPEESSSRRGTLELSHDIGPSRPAETQRAVPSQSRSADAQRTVPNQLSLSHAPPMAQGIPLIPVSELPDRLKTVFPFPLFNAVQSKCFQNVYKSDDNFVLSSPTGSGKTAILELAICRAINNHTTGQYKIVYQAPTKSLCSERQRDWQKKFGPLGLECVELTGDSEASNLRGVQTASIIVTTPEKWDSMTRKWKDHERLMKLIKLFLIDEVHILKDTRGATLEAVVSRMKSMDTYVRFVALSATVPNFEDVAVWLGKNAFESHQPAVSQKFGEEFRPVKLQRHVVGYHCNGNDFVFEKMLDSKLPEVITKFSQRKPIMVFCFTRASTVSTAKALANWWATRNPRDRHWEAPKQRLQFEDSELRNCAASGVAFHHAGLDQNDRLSVENGFLKGDVNVICCTSTLAVGVNLPCHLVIIKNTVSWGNTGATEYADLEIMQMLGRAGRPQFDDSGVAVIMTRGHKVRRYEAMVTGQDLLESSLHLNLIDHMNAEIGLGTITDRASAKRWLAGTFLYVRLRQNPEYYKLEGSRSGQGTDEQLDDICTRDITLLQETALVVEGQRLKCTEFGDAMSRYYVEFETMRGFMALEPKAKISELLSALVQAAEFKEIRFRSGEKQFYKDLNRNASIRFPIPVDIALPAHKVSLIVQSVLGGVQISWDDQFKKHRPQYNTEVSLIFRHVHRLIRCIIDCQLCLGDSVSARNALMLERSLGAQAWDDTPLQMRQIQQLGPVAVRKLATGGIRSIEELECTEPHRIEMILNKNPPFGLQLLNRLKLFPKLRVSVRVIPNTMLKQTDGVSLKVKVEMGFMNEKPISVYGKKLVMVSMLAETSDGRKMQFARISGQRMGNGQDVIFPVLLTDADQCINCYIMCDEIAGTLREASAKPKIPSSMFPPPKPKEPVNDQLDRPIPNTSRRRSDNSHGKRPSSGTSDEFGDDGIDDADLLQAVISDLDFDHIENYSNPTAELTRKNTAKNSKDKPIRRASEVESNPVQLPNGNWACNHRCKDKDRCRHYCCKEGLDHPPKKAAKKSAPTDEASLPSAPKKPSEERNKAISRQSLSKLKRGNSKSIDVLDMTHDEKRRKIDYGVNMPDGIRHLQQLQNSIQRKDPPKSMTDVMHKKPTYSYAGGKQPSLTFMGGAEQDNTDAQSDYGDFPSDDLDIPIQLNFDEPKFTGPQADDDPYSDVDFDDMSDGLPEAPDTEAKSDSFGDVGSLFGDDIIDIVDNQVVEDSTRQQVDNEPGSEALPDPADAPDAQCADDQAYSKQHDRILSDRPIFCGPDTSSPQPPPVKLPNREGLLGRDDRAFKSALSLLNMDTGNPPERGRDLHPDNDPGVQAGFSSMNTGTGGLSERALLPHNNGVSTAMERKTELMTEKIAAPAPVQSGEPMQEDRVEEEEMKEEDNDENKENIANVPPGFEDIQPWLLAEFGDIVDIEQS